VPKSPLVEAAIVSGRIGKDGLLIAAAGTPAGERFLFVRYQRRSVKKRAGIFSVFVVVLVRLC
jgi:hypothetical protein